MNYWFLYYISSMDRVQKKIIEKKHYHVIMKERDVDVLNCALEFASRQKLVILVFFIA